MQAHTRKSRQRQRSLLTTSELASLKEEELFLLKPTGWYMKLIAFLMEIVANFFLHVFFFFFYILTLLFEPFRHLGEAKDNAEKAVNAITEAPVMVMKGGLLVLKKLGFGIVGAIFVCLLLMTIFLFSIVIGVGFVKLCSEEPVFMSESLFFDYTEVNPSTVVQFGSIHGKMKRGVPLGHRFFVSLVLLMPESDFNRDMGIFQLTAEAISVKGNTLAKSSQPCMLRFRSLPVRLMRTSVLVMPLLMGLARETQKISVPLLDYKEGTQRTEAIRVTLMPRAGTSSLPELYSAELIMHTELPWKKELVHKWKWTLYVWTSLNIYIFLLLVFICYFRPFVFPILTIRTHTQADHTLESRQETHHSRAILEEEESSDDLVHILRTWRQRKSKRNSRDPSLDGNVPVELSGSTFSGGATSEVIEDPTMLMSDSDSVCDSS